MIQQHLRPPTARRCDTMAVAAHPLRLAIIDEQPLVVAGVSAFLAGENIDVVETGDHTGGPAVDLVLLDTARHSQTHGLDLEHVVRDSGAKVVVYSWSVDPQLIDEALAAGASGYLSKVLTGPQVVAALRRVIGGEIVVLVTDPETTPDTRQPGHGAGLSPREAEVIALITQGFSNQEIADRIYLGINTIKTYIRSAYRKIGVTRRSQAVLWGTQNGMCPDLVSAADPVCPARPVRKRANHPWAVLAG